MKALTVKQPWASLICMPREDNPSLGIKDIENRTWRTKFRGRIFIHASAKSADVDFSTQQTAELFESGIWNPDNGFSDKLNTCSAIIGEVEIIDCVLNHPSIWAENKLVVMEEERRNEVYDIWNWVLANPILYDNPIINVKGKLSFWEPDKNILQLTLKDTP